MRVVGVRDRPKSTFSPPIKDLFLHGNPASQEAQQAAKDAIKNRK